MIARQGNNHCPPVPVGNLPLGQRNKEGSMTCHVGNPDVHAWRTQSFMDNMVD